MEWLDEYLDERKKQHLLRTLKPLRPAGSGRVCINDVEYLNFSSNDYLGLAGHPRLLEESQKGFAPSPIGERHISLSSALYNRRRVDGYNRSDTQCA